MDKENCGGQPRLQLEVFYQREDFGVVFRAEMLGDLSQFVTAGIC